SCEVCEMVSVLSSSMKNVILIRGTTIVPETYNHFVRCDYQENSTSNAVSFKKLRFPHLASLRLFSRYRRWTAIQPKFRVHNLAANGAEETVEEPVSAIAHEDANESSKLPFLKSGTPSLTAEHGIKPHVKSNRRRPLRKSQMPPVKNEELIPGATFTGKVRSIQPFGAFVDIGAFTEGLIHISNMSDGYVTDVKSIVSIGQEVKVRLVEASVERGRIALTLRESNGTDDLQQKTISSSNNNDKNPSPARRNLTKTKQNDLQQKTISSSSNNDNNPSPAKRNPTKTKLKSSKFVIGQELEGTIRKFIRVGSFISLPEGGEGFLPKSEEVVEDFENMEGSSLQVGQKIRVRVLHVTNEQVTLTMKKEDGVDNPNTEEFHGVIHEATNPFMLAFRTNKGIAKFLDEREKWT
ncbi:hypothetical protein AQUCO_00100362v1, partial [Aquilegia coerulea]